jgi:hypothetical protein
MRKVPSSVATFPYKTYSTGSEPTVLDNSDKSLFGMAVAVTTNFQSRDIQEVTRDVQRPRGNIYQ